MIDRRQLLTWWRKPPPAPRPAPRRDEPPPLARVVEPTRVDDPEPFSLESFYAARTKERR